MIYYIYRGGRSMNRKGFTLIELLGSMLLLAVILGIGLYTTRDTLSTSLSTLTSISKSEILNASKNYVFENAVTWVNDGEEYTCLTVNDLIDAGYFDMNEVLLYKDNIIKVMRDSTTRVIVDTDFVDACE